MIEITVTEKPIPKIKFPKSTKTVDETSVSLMLHFEQRLRELEEKVHSLQLEVNMMRANSER